MAEERFDCIIVGGGLAGLTAAYILAKEGQEVLLIERGNYSGAKNMTGGRLYGHSLEKVIPGFAKNAPVERRVVKERLSVIESGNRIIKETDSAETFERDGESYLVLRGKFDRWLAEQAESQGAMLVCGVRVDDLIVRDGRVCGVIAGDEEMEADVVILADGVNSLLAGKLGYKKAIGQDEAAVGAKEVIGLSEELVNQRFSVNSGEGVAWMFPECGGVYDGFLYTNKDSISVGVTMKVENIKKADKSVPQMLEEFKSFPEIAALLEGGNLLEYSAHLIPEGGVKMIPRLYGDGVLIAGDAAALCANLGYTLHGMDLAVESGRLAALTVLEAKEKEDFSAKTFSLYKKALEESSAMSWIKESKTEEFKEVFGQSCKAKKVNVAEKLGVNKYNTDEHNPHIEIDKEFPDQEEIERVVRVCPAALYSVDENGNLFFDYLGCLECGTCKVLSEGKVIKDWNYPASTKGVEYRFG